MNNVYSRDGFYCELLLCLLISYNKFILSNIGFLLKSRSSLVILLIEKMPPIDGWPDTKC